MWCVMYSVQAYMDTINVWYSHYSAQNYSVVNSSLYTADWSNKNNN